MISLFKSSFLLLGISFVFLYIPCCFSLSITNHLSPNFDQRLLPQPPDTLVIHQSKLNCESSLNEMLKSESTFSVHYFVCSNGSVYRLVQENMRAWHSGYSYWHSRLYLDDWSIGIQIDANPEKNNLKLSLVSLIKDVRTRYVIPNTLIASGMDVNLDINDHRDQNLVNGIPWEYLNLNGIGIYPKRPRMVPKSAVFVKKAYHMLKSIGYFENSQDSSNPNSQFTRTLLAFQTRFIKGHATGTLDQETYSTLLAVLAEHNEIMNPFYSCYTTPSQVRTTTQPLEMNTSFVSKNVNDRLLGPPFMLVIHDTETDLERALQILTGNTPRQVSIHYIVSRDGAIYKLADENMRTWHAGKAYWNGYYYLNDISIGIEMINENSAIHRYTNAQIVSVINLIKDIRTRWYIPDQYILSHEDITPLYRSDPGVFFPWDMLHRNEIGFMPSDQLKVFSPCLTDRHLAVQKMHEMLKIIGYRMDNQSGTEIDKRFALSLERFQWRFLPNVKNWSTSQPVVPSLCQGLIAMKNIYTQAYLKDSKRCRFSVPGTTERSKSGSKGHIISSIYGSMLFLLLFSVG